VHLFEQLSGSNLILIDEIFNSTSSEEASALALAIFKKLREIHNCHIVVSSHHQTLKTILHQDNTFISAHVGFELESNTPTYKIHIGSPGSSFALNIFKSMTKDNPELDSLFENSIQFLDNKAIHYEKLLEQISQKENELNKLLNENREINDHIKNQKSAMEGVIKLKIDEKVNKAQKDIEKHINKAKQLFDEIKSSKVTKEKVIYNVAHDLKKKVADNSPFKEEYNPITHTNLQDPKEYIVGKKYFSLLLNKTVLLKKVNLRRNEGFVGAGNLTIKTPLNKLKLANASGAQVAAPISQGTVERSINTSIEYDCRGQRLDAFQDTVHKAISNLLMGDIPFVNIVHGHGNGVLKSWLRKFLKNHKDLKIDTEETGNDGATRIVLK
jgi:DNA mismatch repair protein MutS2